MSDPDTRSLALFDLDHTLLPIDSDKSWGTFFASLPEVEGAPTHEQLAKYYQDYLAGTLDIFAYLRTALAPLARYSRADLARWHQRFMTEIILPAVRPEACDLVARHRAAGDLCCLVTATNVFITAPIARHFGIEHLIGVELETEDAEGKGRYTGRPSGIPSFREGKVVRTEQWLHTLQLDWHHFARSYFYSDSLNDLPLLEKVSHPVATNPDPGLRVIAHERGWPILDLFSAPPAASAPPTAVPTTAVSATAASATMLESGARAADAAEAADNRCGSIALVGRPNVGKSTLLNRLVGQKVSIVSRKAQTTRHRIRGIYTETAAERGTSGHTQFIFVDTPGYQIRYRSTLNRAMNRNVSQALAEVDVVLMLIEARGWTAEDDIVRALLPRKRPVLLVINKVDQLATRDRLLPMIADLQARYDWQVIVPVSAEKDWALDTLLAAIRPCLPVGEALYDADQVTDRDERFLAAELIREKIFRFLGDELPYAATVQIDEFRQQGALRRIAATILVERSAHKAILIGAGGQQLKRIAQEARYALEHELQGKIFLHVWVKVCAGWAEKKEIIGQ